MEPQLPHPSVLPLARSSDVPRRVGERGSALVRIARRGVAVPDTWIVDSDPLRDLLETRLPPGHEPRSILKITKARPRAERAARARALVRETLLPDGLIRGLGAALGALGAPVRLLASPSLEPDDLGASSRGIVVSSEEELRVGLRETWGTVFSERTLGAAARRGAKDVTMGVVMMARLPDAPDAVRLFVGPRSLRARRPRDVRIEPTGDVVTLFEDGTPDGPGLPDGAPAELVRVFAEIDDVLTDPAYVEVVWHAGKVTVVDVWHASARGWVEGGTAGTVWSRANVGESLPRAPTPLSWSLTEGMADASIRRSLSTLGCPVPKDAPLVARVAGRPYMNLSTVVRVAAQLPGLTVTALSGLLGSEGFEALAEQTVDVSRTSFYARLPLTAARLLSEQTRLAGEVAAFDEVVGEARRTLSDLDLAILPDDGLVPTLRDARTLLERANEVLAMATTAHVTSYLLLKTALGRSFPVTAERLAQALTTGASELASVRIPTELSRVAEVVRADPEAGAALAAGARTLRAIPDGPTRRALERFLRDHGDRAIGEGEMAKPRWRTDPSPVLAMLAALVRGGVRATRAQGRGDRELSIVEKRMPLLEIGVVRVLVERTRRFAELRERVRATYGASLGMMHEVTSEVDRRVRRVDPSLPVGAAFLCTFEELVVAMATGRPDVGHLARLRAADREADAAVPEPPVTFVGRPPVIERPARVSPVLHGVPASGGTAAGTVRVLHGAGDLADVEAGDILVVSSADAAMAPVLLLAGGIVTEQGGPLTHLAMVARELGVPSVVQLDGATRVLAPGSRVRVDGDAGVIERIEGA